MYSRTFTFLSHIFQLVVEDNKILHDKITMRHGPCLCTAHEISCSNNDMCHKFKNYNEHAKLRAWKVHRLNKGRVYKTPTKKNIRKRPGDACDCRIL